MHALEPSHRFRAPPDTLTSSTPLEFWMHARGELLNRDGCERMPDAALSRTRLKHAVLAGAKVIE
jgi:hypothetical protein